MQDLIPVGLIFINDNSFNTMKISTDQISEFNKNYDSTSQAELEFLKTKLTKKGISVEEIIDKVADFQVAIPSWALGAGGTRFGRFRMVENLLP